MTDKEPDFRLRYNRNLPEPNRLVVWDVKNNKEYTKTKFLFLAIFFTFRLKVKVITTIKNNNPSR